MRRLPQDRARGGPRRSFVRYKPLELGCGSCHADIHQGQFLAARSRPACRCRRRVLLVAQAAGSRAAAGWRRKARDCDFCHKTEDFKHTVFNHNDRRFTTYALDGKAREGQPARAATPRSPSRKGSRPSATDRCRAPARTATSTSTTVSSGGSSRDARLETRRLHGVRRRRRLPAVRGAVVRRWRRRPTNAVAAAPKPKGGRGSGPRRQAVASWRWGRHPLRRLPRGRRVGEGPFQPRPDRISAARRPHDRRLRWLPPARVRRPGRRHLLGLSSRSTRRRVRPRAKAVTTTGAGGRCSRRTPTGAPPSRWSASTASSPASSATATCATARSCVRRSPASHVTGPTLTAPVTSIDHATAGFSVQCQSCHNTWRFWPARLPQHDVCFRLTSGSHNGIRCLGCHSTLPPPIHSGTCTVDTLTCTGCHAHECDKSNRQHANLAAYQCVNDRCYECHAELRGQ